VQGFFKSIAMIVVSEIGDKTFFVAAVCVQSSPIFFWCHMLCCWQFQTTISDTVLVNSFERRNGCWKVCLIEQILSCPAWNAVIKTVGAHVLYSYRSVLQVWRLCNHIEANAVNSSDSLTMSCCLNLTLVCYTIDLHCSRYLDIKLCVMYFWENLVFGSSWQCGILE
jgi:hypothetical protein